MNEKPICVYIPGWAFDGYNARHKRYTFTSFLSDTVVALPRLQPTTRMQYSVTMFSDWRHSTSDIRIVIRVIIAYDNSTTTYMTTFIVTYNNVLHSLFHIVSGWVGTGVRGTEVPPPAESRDGTPGKLGGKASRTGPVREAFPPSFTGVPPLGYQYKRCQCIVKQPTAWANNYKSVFTSAGTD